MHALEFRDADRPRWPDPEALFSARVGFVVTFERAGFEHQRTAGTGRDVLRLRVTA